MGEDDIQCCERGGKSITHDRDSLDWQNSVIHSHYFQASTLACILRATTEEAECLTFISALSQHGSGEAGCLDLLAAQAQCGLRGLDPAAYMLAKNLTSKTHQRLWPAAILSDAVTESMHILHLNICLQWSPCIALVATLPEILVGRVLTVIMGM